MKAFPVFESGFTAWYLLRPDFLEDRYDIWEGDYEDHARSRLNANDQRDKYASFYSTIYILSKTKKWFWNNLNRS